LQILEKDIECLKKIVKDTHTSLSELVLTILERENENVKDPNYPVFIAEKLVNLFMLYLLGTVYEGNARYAFQVILVDEISKLASFDKKINMGG